MKKIIIIAVTLFILYGIISSYSLQITTFSYKTDKLPSQFNGYKIVHVSDFHNWAFCGQDVSQEIAKLNPDIIVISGDLINKWSPDFNAVKMFAQKLCTIAPTYFSPGNHEAWIENEYTNLKSLLQDVGVVVLENQSIIIKNSIELIGIMDPFFGSTNAEVFNTNNFKMLIAHRPELINFYAQNDVDIAFSGHAHGGQFRLPFIGAIIAPNQGLFPKYTDGEYKCQNTTMYVSRGLGTSVIPMRFFCRPQINLITIN